MTSEVPEFQPFGKIHRLNREYVLTEKIDGTNALVSVADDGTVRAGSRSRWITPEDDNFCFAAWVAEHADDLRTLGAGRHFGEWWGRGIQRTYGLTERRFSLFNVSRWLDDSVRPKCCHVVPRLDVAHGVVALALAVAEHTASLRGSGSWAAPGFDRPEGIVIFHVPSQALFKVTLARDEEPKGKAAP